MTTPQVPADQEWAKLAEADEKTREAQIRTRYVELASVSDDERQKRVAAMAQAEFALPDDQMRAFTLSRMRVGLGLEPDMMRKISTTYDAIADQLPGTIAMRRIALLQTLVKEFSPDEQQRLRAMSPHIFAVPAVTVVATTPPPAPSQAAQPTSKPRWAFWKRQ
ncbi:MAG: hypothetical protein HYX97_04900 [Chloroflexi bacterium]|nr:hypothetical protein [Chloroflexota bacterium]